MPGPPGGLSPVSASPYGEEVPGGSPVEPDGGEVPAGESGRQGSSRGLNARTRTAADALLPVRMHPPRGSIRSFPSTLRPQALRGLVTVIPGAPYARDLDEQVVLMGARPRPSPAELEVLRALVASHGPGELDPARVVELARRTRTLPQLARNLARAEGGTLRPRWDALRRVSERLARKNLSRIRALLLLAELLDEEGIPFIPFKGPVLAREAYGEATLRHYKDLDILIAPGDLPAAVAHLRGAGYQERSPARALSAAQLQALPRWFRDTQLSMSHPELGVEVELHWSLLPRLLFPGVGDLTASPGEVSLGPRTMRSLRPEAQFVYLCAHGSKHGWTRVGWVTDLAAFLRSERARSMDWDEVVALAGRTGLAPALSFGAMLAEDAMGTALPLPVASAVAPFRKTLEPPVRRAGRAMWSGDGEASPDLVLRRMQGAHAGKARGTLRLLASLSLPGLHLLDSRPLPASLFPLYLADNVRHLAARGMVRAAGFAGPRDA